MTGCKDTRRKVESPNSTAPTSGIRRADVIKQTIDVREEGKHKRKRTDATVSIKQCMQPATKQRRAIKEASGARRKKETEWKHNKRRK